MKILIAGATGAIGRQLVPPLVVDILDTDAVAAAVASFEPEVIVHEATALSSLDSRHFDRSFAVTNRLRTDGIDHLLAAGRAVGIRRFLAQSFAGWPFARVGSLVKTEDDPLDPNPIGPMRSTIAAIRHLEAAVIGAEWTDGIVLRYGGLYGPGTSLDADAGEMTQMIRKRFLPIVGDGAGMTSFIHVADAADTTVAAVERGARGVYQVVDDEPAPMGEWLPVAADALGAKPPLHIPLWLGRLVGGEVIVTMSTETRGASNERGQARARLDAASRVVARQPGPDGGVTGTDAGTELEALRRRAFAIAYRMLGSVAEAEGGTSRRLARCGRRSPGSAHRHLPMSPCRSDVAKSVRRIKSRSLEGEVFRNAEKCPNTDVLVHIRPMHGRPHALDHPVLALLRRCGLQAP